MSVLKSISAGAALAAAITVLPAVSASAKAAPTGDFAVTVNGTTYKPASGR